MTPLIPFLLPVLITVDRIEPPMAVVEWPSGAMTDIPLAMLPPNTKEGSQLLLQPMPTGLFACTSEPSLLMESEP